MPESAAPCALESALELIGAAITVAAEAGGMLAGRQAGRSETAILIALRELRDALASVQLTAEAVAALVSAAFAAGGAARGVQADAAAEDGEPRLRLAAAN